MTLRIKLSPLQMYTCRFSTEGSLGTGIPEEVTKIVKARSNDWNCGTHPFRISDGVGRPKFEKEKY